MAETFKDIEFWFDFNSPYAYFASLRIDELGRRHGRRVLWRPFLLGVAFKVTGLKEPPVKLPLKGDYFRRDWDRMARAAGVAFRFPDQFPISPVAPSRMFYALQTNDDEAAIRFAKACYHAFFVEGRDISQPRVAAACGAEIGRDDDALLAANDTPAIKDLLRARSDEAVAKGVFGAPFFFIDGEPFWGSDRLEEMDRWLARGGW